jgi:hypothetical protein
MMSRAFAFAFAIAVAIAVAGCERQKTPISPSTVAAAQPAPTPNLNLRLSGVVTETLGGRPVSDVSVTSAPYCGYATTDRLGHYLLKLCIPAGGQYPPDGAPLTVKVSATGFESQTRESHLTSETLENFVLSPITTSTANIDGAWTITITAAASCTALPEIARVRQYDATIEQLDARVIVNLSSPTITVYSTPVGGSGTIVDRTLSFTITGDTGPIVEPWGFWDYPDFVDRLGPTELLAIVGGVEGTVAGSEIRGVMSGEIEYWGHNSTPTVGSPPSVVCSAKDHSIVLRRR